MTDQPSPRVEIKDCDRGAATSAVDAFEMGYVFANCMQGQSLEDSRAVGRNLLADSFAPLHTKFKEIIDRDGFNSFQSADLGIVACKAIFREALAQAEAAAVDVEPVTGWIVGNGNDNKWRTWQDGFSVWTEKREEATRYARREDAEAVHAEDEDAWRVELYAHPPQAVPYLHDMQISRLLERDEIMTRFVAMCEGKPDNEIVTLGLSVREIKALAAAMLESNAPPYIWNEAVEAAACIVDQAVEGSRRRDTAAAIRSLKRAVNG